MNTRKNNLIQVLAAMRYLARTKPNQYRLEHLENHAMVLYRKSIIKWVEVQRVSVFENVEDKIAA